MESTSGERLNVAGAAGIAVIVIAWMVQVVLGSQPAVLILGALLGIALGVVAMKLNHPGKELGTIALALGVISLVGATFT